MTFRVEFTAQPGEHFVIRREAFRRITEALEAKGIYYAHRKVIVELSASPGFKFEQLNIEQPNGGGVQLFGIGGAIVENCIVADTSNQVEAVFLFDRHLNNQSELEATMI
jgi:hypothetical protein